MPIVTVEQWRSQPQYPVEIDYNNGLFNAAGGSQIYVMLAPHRLLMSVSGVSHLVKLSGGTVSPIGDTEVALNGSGSTDDGWSTPDNFDALSGATSLSGFFAGSNLDQAVVVGRWSSAANFGGFLVTGGYPGAGSLSVIISPINNIATWRSRNVTPGSGKSKFGFTWAGGSALETYLNGVPGGTDADTAAPSAIQTVSEKLYFCRHGDGGSGSSNPTKVSLAVIAPGVVWSDAVHRELNANPWQIFRPERRVIVSLPATAGLNAAPSRWYYEQIGHQTHV